MTKILMIGFGYWGKIQYKTFKNNPSCKIVGIVDENIEILRVARGGDALKDNNVAFISDNLDDTINNYGFMFDAVVITTPPETHSVIIQTCLKAGKHVFCEKPLVLNQVDLDECHKLASERSLVLYCGYNYLHSLCYNQIFKLRDEIGEILTINAVRTHYGHIRKDVSPFYDLCVHDLSVIFDLFPNKCAIDIKNVQKFGLIEKVDGFFANFDIIDDALQENSTICSIYNCWVSPKKQRTMEIIGTNGCIFIDEMAEKQVKLIKHGSEFLEFAPNIDNKTSLEIQAEDFLKFVAGIKQYMGSWFYEFDAEILHALDSLSKF